MISAMPAVALRRERKRSLGRFNFPSSHHSSTTSLSGRNKGSIRRHGQSISTIGSHGRAFPKRRRLRYESELDRQRRRFLVYMGTLFLITGLLLIFIGVGAQIRTAQTVGLLLIGVGAALCIIKVFITEAHLLDVPPKVAVVADPESNSNDPEKAEEGEATPLANISEFTELNESEGAKQKDANDHSQNNVTPTSPPNGIPETQVLIGNDSNDRRY